MVKSRIRGVNDDRIAENRTHVGRIFRAGQKRRRQTFDEYLLVSQTKALVTLYQKHNERFRLQGDYAAGETLRLSTLDFDLNVDDVYRGVIFPPRAEEVVSNQ